jgi:hypothetical protein
MRKMFRTSCPCPWSDAEPKGAPGRVRREEKTLGRWGEVPLKPQQFAKTLADRRRVAAGS